MGHKARQTLEAEAENLRSHAGNPKAWAKQLWIKAGLSEQSAEQKAQNPDVSLWFESDAARGVKALIEAVEHEQAISLPSNLEKLRHLASMKAGVLMLWALPDGSAWVSLKGSEWDWACQAANSLEWADDLLLTQIWKTRVEGVTTSDEVAKAFARSSAKGWELCALSADQAAEWVCSLTRAWKSKDGSWAKGISQVRWGGSASAAQTIKPEELKERMLKELAKGQEELIKETVRRLEAMRKEKRSVPQKPWRTALIEWMADPTFAPALDAGLAAYWMVKPGSFHAENQSAWKHVFDQAQKASKEGVEWSLPTLEKWTEPLGEEAAAVARFLARSASRGSPRESAKKDFEAAIRRAKGKEMSAAQEELPETRSENATLMAGAEATARRGAALSMEAGLWIRENGFEDPKTMAKALWGALSGAAEIRMECMGWSALLTWAWAEGFLSKQSILDSFMEAIQEDQKEKDEQKKIKKVATIENEWSGEWAATLAQRKIAEYLELNGS